MAGRPPPSNFESPLMQEVPEHQGNSTDSSGSSLGSTVTACKKILCSNSLLESTDYWLQNQRTPCQIGFLEDKSESNCASNCSSHLGYASGVFGWARCSSKRGNRGHLTTI